MVVKWCQDFNGVFNMQISMSAPLSFSLYHIYVPLFHKLYLIVPSCSKNLEGSLIILQCIWLKTLNEELCVLYEAFRLGLNTSSGRKLVIKILS